MKLIKIIGKIDDMFAYFGGALFILLIAVVFIQVILRYAFSTSFIWGEEVCRFAFICFVYTGIATCTRRDSHLRVDLIPSKLHGTKKKILYVINMLIFLVFSLFVTYYGYDTVLLVRESQQVALTVSIPLAIVWAIIPLSFLFSSLHTIVNIAKVFMPEEMQKEVSVED